MMVKALLAPAGRSAALVAIAAMALGFAASAYAQQQQQQPPATGFSQPRSPAAPSAGATRYTDMASDQSFVIEERGRGALLQFEGSDEVIPLQAVPAQRGDTFLKTDSGQVVLRKTEAGNMVSFIGNKDGAPADIVGRAAPLNAPPMPASLNEVRAQAAARLSKMAGHEVTIFGTAEFSDDEQWAADALRNVELGVQTANGLAGRVASKLTEVRLERAKAANVTFKDGALVLSVNPEQGYAGRPSSDAIANELTRARSTG
jgi:hypothetical protein